MAGAPDYVTVYDSSQLAPGVVLYQHLAADVNEQRAVGAYVGDGGAKAIVCGFRPREVTLNRKDGTRAVWRTVDPDETDKEYTLRAVDGGVITCGDQVSLPGIDITATGFTVTGNANVNLANYSWCAKR